MLLGQIVGIAFATNLFFISLLVSPPRPPPPSSIGIYRRKWLGPWLLQLLTILFVQFPAYMLANEHYWFHQTDFLPMLLAPHAALLILPGLRAILPSKYFTDSNVEFAGTVYKYLWGTTILGGGLLFLKMTWMAHDYSGLEGIWHALLEHPAVSSVAFDSIFCWLSWVTWWRVQRQSAEATWRIDEVNHGGEWAGAPVGVASGADGNREMRRR
jgi:hypothetical protein